MTDTAYHFDPSHLESNREYLDDMRASVRQSARNVERAYDNAAHHEKLRLWYLLRTLLLEVNLTEQLAGPDADHMGDPKFPARPSANPRFVVIDGAGSQLVIRDQVDGIDLPLTPVAAADKRIVERVAGELNYWRAGVVLREPPSPELPDWYKYARRAPRVLGSDDAGGLEPHEFVFSGDVDRDSQEGICGYRGAAGGTRCGAASGSTAHLDYLRRHRDLVESWPPSTYKIEVYRALGWEYPAHA